MLRRTEPGSAELRLRNFDRGLQTAGSHGLSLRSHRAATLRRDGRLAQGYLDHMDCAWGRCAFFNASMRSGYFP